MKFSEVILDEYGLAPDRAFELLCRSTQRGNTDAMLRLAHCYRLGDGTRKSPKQAFDFYRNRT